MKNIFAAVHTSLLG